MRKRDFILIGIILITAISLFLGIELTKRDGDKVVVQVKDEVVEVISLSDTGTYILNGGTNTLRIENHQAFIIEATCPDKKCMHEFGDHGKISKVGEVITCLPNKLTIRVVDGSYKA